NERSKLADDSERTEREKQSTQKPATATDQVAVVSSADAPAQPAPPSSAKAIEDRKQPAAEVAEAKVQTAPQSVGSDANRSLSQEESARKRAGKDEAGTTVGVFTVGRSGLKKEKAANAVGAAASTDEPDRKGERDRSDKDESETTSIAGHQFRR